MTLPAQADERILEALRGIRLSPQGKDLFRAGLVREARIEGSRAHVLVELPSPGHPRALALPEEIRAAVVRHVAGTRAEDVRVDLTFRVRAADTKNDRIPGVKNVIAVASGKGGVGKSTVASNLAVGLHLLGARSGLLDLDIFGPSGPVVLGTAAEGREDPPDVDEDGKLLPLRPHGIQFLSMGILAPGDRPVVWRGPMLHKAVMQLADAAWDDLDYLVLDLPPGTGDVQLTVTQSLPLVGAVIVTTPQHIALLDASKGLSMFESARIPILGLVENMAYYNCGKCGKEHAIFGRNGGALLAQNAGVPLLARIPLSPAIMRGADEGRPLVLRDDVPEGVAFRTLAADVAAAIGELSLRTNPFKVLA